MAIRLRLGQLLVDAGMIAQEDLDAVLALQKADGRRLGTLLVEKGLINETQLTQILSHQLSVPWVSLLHIEFSRQLLNLVPHDVAERYCMVPIYVRHVRGQGQTLYVAMDDPTNEEGLRECTGHSGLPVKAMIAPPSDIRNAIRVYYGVSPGKSNAPGAMPAYESVPPNDSRDTSPEHAPPPAMSQPPEIEPKRPDPTPPPSMEVAEITVTSGDLLASEPRVSAKTSEPAAAVAAAAEPTPAPAPVAAAEPAPAPEHDPIAASSPIATAEIVAASAPRRQRLPSAPEISPATLPDPGAGTTDEAQPPARPQAQVSVVDAPALPSKRERLRRVLQVVDESQPPTLDEGGLPPSSQPVDTIPEPRGRAPRMIALTLLDGTTIALPAPRKRKRVETIASPESGPEEEQPPSTLGEDERAGMTARDLVAALRAVYHGADANEILGKDARWEAMFAALLSVLLRKGLVADWEFVEELRKI
jgi:hypothetical protein